MKLLLFFLPLPYIYPCMGFLRKITNNQGKFVNLYSQNQGLHYYRVIINSGTVNSKNAIYKDSLPYC